MLKEEGPTLKEYVRGRSHIIEREEVQEDFLDKEALDMSTGFMGFQQPMCPTFALQKIISSMKNQHRIRNPGDLKQKSLLEHEWNFLN